MKREFTVLVGTTLDKLIGKGTTVKTLRATLTNLNGRDGNKITEKLIGMTDINDAFMVFSKFWSFLEYDILSIIIESFCRHDLKPQLDEYTSLLNEYRKRRVCEVPKGSGGKESEEEKFLHIQVNETEITRMKLEDLKVLRSRLGEILGTSLLSIDIISGSIIISSKCLHEFDVIFHKQKEELREIEFIAKMRSISNTPLLLLEQVCTDIMNK